MSSTPDMAKLAATGARQRTSHLVQQANYTLAVATAEGDPLTSLLPDGHLGTTTQLRDAVEKALQDKTIRADEAKQATNAQNQQMDQAAVWIRKVGKRCLGLGHLGADLPDELCRVSSETTVSGMLDQITKTVALLGQYAPDMDKIGPKTQPLIDLGKQAFQDLQNADSEQERVHATDKPAAVTTFYVTKGKLYNALMAINSAGHELYAHNLPEAAKFNMSILHRRGSQSAPPSPTPPAPTPPAPANHA